MLATYSVVVLSTVFLFFKFDFHFIFFYLHVALNVQVVTQLLSRHFYENTRQASSNQILLHVSRLYDAPLKQTHKEMYCFSNTNTLFILPKTRLYTPGNNATS